MNDDDLDPQVLAALRAVTPASDSLREQHIATALGAIAASRKTPRSAWLSAAAAVVVLLAGATAILRLGASSTDSSVTPRNGAVVTVPVKGAACGAGLSHYTIVGTYSSADSVREVWSSAQNLVVVDQSSCDVLDTIAHPSLVASEKSCAYSWTSDIHEVGAYVVADMSLTLVATAKELQIFGGPMCDLLASHPQP